MIAKIISGGQTGVDQAALAVATALGITVGGWCPKGGLDENSECIRDKYPLTETDSVDPTLRTQQNIRAADGTLLIVPSWPLPADIRDGTQFTYTYAINHAKPVLVIALNDQHDAVTQTLRWLADNKVFTLNVAGPRESSSPGIQDAACVLLDTLFHKIQLS